MLNVACVLKSGGEFSASHVWRLAAQVDRHLLVPHQFVCLTDIPVYFENSAYIRYIRLAHDWVGWFSKIELFRPNLLDGPILYFDLDTLIVGNIDYLVGDHRLTVLRNFWNAKRIGSAVMSWSADLSEVYSKFLDNAGRYIQEYQHPDKWGDQAFLKDHAPVEPEFWQDKLPGRIVSYRRHCLRDAGEVKVPDGASVICYGGKFRPWHTDLGKRVYEEYKQ
jgi:hypothetical protein